MTEKNEFIIKDRNFSQKKFAAHRKNNFFCALKISFKRFCGFPNKSTTKGGNINVVDYKENQRFSSIQVYSYSGEHKK